ncbi:hypothetical protein V2W45_1242251, partial [Cenococcum geophilum]
NNKEKSKQVVKMKDIYAKALNIRVWLRPADKDSNKAIIELNYIGDLIVKEGLVKLRIKIKRLYRN